MIINFVSKKVDKMSVDFPENKSKRELFFEQSLKVSSDEQIISLIEELRDSGEVFVVKPLLNEYFKDSRGEKLKTSVIEFITDIRDQNIVPVITDIIRDNINNKEITPLISACWQSRLDFSKHLNFFVDLLYIGSYESAIEAFSVIESSLDYLDKNAILVLLDSIKSRSGKASPEKLALVTETIKMIEEYQVE